MGRLLSLGCFLRETIVTSNSSPPLSFGSRFTALRGLLEVGFFVINSHALNAGKGRKAFKELLPRSAEANTSLDNFLCERDVTVLRDREHGRGPRRLGSRYLVSRSASAEMKGSIPTRTIDQQSPHNYNGRCIRPRSQPIPRATAAAV
jgi:hypothetical protein